jgi:hypothetical protein
VAVTSDDAVQHRMGVATGRGMATMRLGEVVRLPHAGAAGGRQLDVRPWIRAAPLRPAERRAESFRRWVDASDHIPVLTGLRWRRPDGATVRAQRHGSDPADGGTSPGTFEVVVGSGDEERFRREVGEAARGAGFVRLDVVGQTNRLREEPDAHE